MVDNTKGRPPVLSSLTTTPADLPQELKEEYELDAQDLGVGAIAVVLKIIHKETKKPFALKVVEKYPLYIRNMLAQGEREVRIQKAVQHDNVVRLVTSLEDENYTYMVLEFCELGMVASYTRNYPQRKVPEPVASWIFQQIVLGVKFLHASNYVHRDLKLANILMTEDFLPKICDFGWSAEIQLEKVLKTVSGTVTHWAPEIFLAEAHDTKVDMWSLGILLYEMLVGHPPFYGETHEELKKKLFKLEFGFPPWVSNEARFVISSLIQIDPRRRWTCEQILQLPWVANAVKPVKHFEKMRTAIEANGGPFARSEHEAPIAEIVVEEKKRMPVECQAPAEKVVEEKERMPIEFKVPAEKKMPNSARTSSKTTEVKVQFIHDSKSLANQPFSEQSMDSTQIRGVKRTGGSVLIPNPLKLHNTAGAFINRPAETHRGATVKRGGGSVLIPNPSKLHNAGGAFINHPAEINCGATVNLRSSSMLQGSSLAVNGAGRNNMVGCSLQFLPGVNEKTKWSTQVIRSPGIHVGASTKMLPNFSGHIGDRRFGELICMPKFDERHSTDDVLSKSTNLPASEQHSPRRNRIEQQSPRRCHTTPRMRHQYPIQYQAPFSYGTNPNMYLPQLPINSSLWSNNGIVMNAPEVMPNLSGYMQQLLVGSTRIRMPAGYMPHFPHSSGSVLLSGHHKMIRGNSDVIREGEISPKVMQAHGMQTHGLPAHGAGSMLIRPQKMRKEKSKKIRKENSVDAIQPQVMQARGSTPHSMPAHSHYGPDALRNSGQKLPFPYPFP